MGTINFVLSTWLEAGPKMKYIFLIAAFNAFFFLTLLLQKKPKALHDHILVYWLIYLGLYTGVYAFYVPFLFTHYPLLSASFISLLLLHGPFLYLYVSSLVLDKKVLGREDLVHFAPFLLFNLYLAAVSFFPGTAQRISLDHVSRQVEPPLLFLGFLILTALSGPLYFILSVRLLKMLDRHISGNFSSSKTMDLDWLRILVFIFGSVWSVLIILTALHHVFGLFSIVFCTNGLSLALSAFILLIGYFGLRQKEIFTHFGEEKSIVSTPLPKYAGSGLKEADAKAFAAQLVHYMETEKPYLDPDISLPQLAGALQIPAHTLSQVINESFQKNFFDFINGYRIEEVKVKITDPALRHYSILGLAYDCGFNSKSAFNRIFKKFTGLTPTHYRTLHGG